MTGSGTISQTQAEAEIEQTFDAIIENSPNSISAKYVCLKLGRKHFDSGQWADAARYFELFRRNFGDESGVADVVYDLGKAYEQLGQVSLAVAVYEQFLSTQPSAKIQEELEKLQSKL